MVQIFDDSSLINRWHFLFTLDNTYHFPICVWLVDTHPYNAPICFVKPTNDMHIKVKHPSASTSHYEILIEISAIFLGEHVCRCHWKGLSSVSARLGANLEWFAGIDPSDDCDIRWTSTGLLKAEEWQKSATKESSESALQSILVPDAVKLSTNPIVRFSPISSNKSNCSWRSATLSDGRFWHADSLPNKLALNADADQLKFKFRHWNHLWGTHQGIVDISYSG